MTIARLHARASRPSRLLVPLLVLCFLVGAPSERAAAQTGEADRQEAPAADSGTARDAGPAATGADRIRPGDVIRLDIWREPTMSGRYLVDENGEVVLPRLGRMRVTDTTPDALLADIKEQYQRYLRNPSIDVTVLRRITVNGAVNKPGLYPVDPTNSISDVLAEAGGVTPVGDRDNIRVLRRGEELELDVSEVTRVAETPIRSGDMIYVPERSWISRHTGIVASAVSGAISLVIAFAVR